MLMNHTMDKLRQMRLSGMVEAIREQQENPHYQELSFGERLGHLVEREWLLREERRFARRLREAKLRQRATVEELDFHVSRRLDRAFILDLAGCEWIRRYHNLIITGPTGVGKTYLACALGHRACVMGYRVRYHRVGRLLSELALGRGDGSYLEAMKVLAKVQLLILDDWGLRPLTGEEALDLLEVIEDRHQRGSTLIISQVPVEAWHQLIGDGTIADAILGRLVHSAYRVEMEGESMRKQRGKVSTVR
jgi:DNA replication protein DnaC